jgi:hypothetical protein
VKAWRLASRASRQKAETGNAEKLKSLHLSLSSGDASARAAVSKIQITNFSFSDF